MLFLSPQYFASLQYVPPSPEIIAQLSAGGQPYCQHSFRWASPFTQLHTAVAATRVKVISSGMGR